MKKGLHPDNYRPVVFQDLNDNTTFLTRSTVSSDETIELDGVTYPLVKVHISSSSHPFFTGEERIVDVEGRVDKFKARQAAARKARETRASSKPKSKKSKAQAQKLGTKTSASR
ncbi:MAG TPA: type B 50S ribosomal protein L31 [Candidatus Saccharimonadales bacterium]|nr:type B 50S ribosomal protein L31 [Candidatus Saccharimonadales bacterium]